jgi:Uma2 family endonuclease
MRGGKTMAEPAPGKATYEDLFNIPENMTGEIIDGELHVTPRPSRDHVHSATSLGGEIVPLYQFGRGGPGGWIILVEPEIMFGDDLLVPDLAGWKRERFPVEEPHNWISVSPDWVCELLSPGTMRKDRVHKMRIYALRGVPHLWLIDPTAKSLEVFQLDDSGRWIVLGVYFEDDKVCAEPFSRLEFDLSNLWLQP